MIGIEWTISPIGERIGLTNKFNIGVYMVDTLEQLLQLAPQSTQAETFFFVP